MLRKEFGKTQDLESLEHYVEFGPEADIFNYFLLPKALCGMYTVMQKAAQGPSPGCISHAESHAASSQQSAKPVPVLDTKEALALPLALGNPDVRTAGKELI